MYVEFITLYETYLIVVFVKFYKGIQSNKFDL